MDKRPGFKKTDSSKAESQAKQKDFGYFSDVLKMLGGNGFVQVFKTIVSPIISRLYLPEYFGVLQNFSSIANIFSIISSLRYDQTIVLPKKEEQAVNQFATSILLVLVTTPIVVLLVYFFKDDVARLLKSPELEDYLWFVPLSFLVVGIFNVLKQWNTRKRQFLRLSTAQVASEVTSDGMAVGFGFAGMASGSTMIISRIAGQVVSSLALGFLIFREDGRYIFSQVNWKIIKQGIITYKKFPLYSIWAAFLSNASLYLPGLLLSGYFSPTEAGYYSMGNNVVRLPVALIATSIGQVFTQRSAKSFNEGRLAQTVLDTFKRLVVFGLFPMLVITIIGKELFILVFGTKWAEAGVYSQILSVWTFFVFLVSPVSNLTNVLGKNEVSVIINVVKVITGIASLIIGGTFGSARLGLWLFSITGIITYAVYILWVNNASGVPLKITTKILLENLLFCAPFLFVVLIFKYINPVPDISLTKLGLSLHYFSLVLVSAIMGVLYYLAAIHKDPTLKEAMGSVIGNIKTRRAEDISVYKRKN